MKIDHMGALLTTLRAASTTMGASQGRVLVDGYYTIQRERIRMGNRVKAMAKLSKPTVFVEGLASMYEAMEDEIAIWLDAYSGAHPLGQWARTVKGVGPVIAAGLAAYVDVTTSTNVSKLWSFAGLNPDMKWGKGEIRPFAAPLKTLCWKLGDSFVKVSNRDGDIYGKLYRERRAYEWGKNVRGEYAHQLDEERRRYGDDTGAKKWVAAFYTGITGDGKGILIAGDPKGLTLEARIAAGGVRMLPPIAIHERAKRFAVKRFLSDLWAVAYELHHKKPAPEPWVIQHSGHTDYVRPPSAVA